MREEERRGEALVVLRVGAVGEEGDGL